MRSPKTKKAAFSVFFVMLAFGIASIVTDISWFVGNALMVFASFAMFTGLFTATALIFDIFTARKPFMFWFEDLFGGFAASLIYVMVLGAIAGLFPYQFSNGGIAVVMFIGAFFFTMVAYRIIDYFR